LLLLDEPTAALDIGQQEKMLVITRSLVNEGHAVVAVLHDLNVARRHADKVLVIHNGRSVAYGSPAEVLVAEQLAVSGCEVVISVTSSGQLVSLGEPPHHVLIERAWRDEGTSLHYLPPSDWSRLDPSVAQALVGAYDDLTEPVVAGIAWTTDAPFRETAAAIDEARAAGCHLVEMEAAGLYAYAEARGRSVVCLAHVTNTMAIAGDDFEKGPANGALATLDVVAATARRLEERR
jgi:ABC-type sulfate/molybdate transport systems ATPase subunit